MAEMCNDPIIFHFNTIAYVIRKSDDNILIKRIIV